MDHREKLLSEVEVEIRTLSQLQETLTLEKTNLLQDVQENLKSSARLEVRIKDLEQAVVLGTATKSRLESTLEDLTHEIHKKESDLSQILPKWEESLSQERETKDQFRECEVERIALYSKQGRAAQFRTKAERDQWIRKEVSAIQGDVKAQEKQVR